VLAFIFLKDKMIDYQLSCHHERNLIRKVRCKLPDKIMKKTTSYKIVIPSLILVSFAILISFFGGEFLYLGENVSEERSLLNHKPTLSEISTDISHSNVTVFNVNKMLSSNNGYWGGVFDGRYIYLVPFDDPRTLEHRWNGMPDTANVLRYDTTQEFQSQKSWEVFDLRLGPQFCSSEFFKLEIIPSSCINDTSNKNLIGVVFDGRYIYLVPYNFNHYPTYPIRYDTTQEFQSLESWEIWALDKTLASAPGKHLGAYDGGVFDGRYIYYVPHGASIHHGEVLRYDTTQEFQSLESWETFDSEQMPTWDTTDLNEEGYGYSGAVFDGKYVYFAPHHNCCEYHATFLRYDTTQEFQSLESWETFDAKKETDLKVGGLSGAAFDGKYVYFAPFRSEANETVRYDTTQEFQSPKSWEVFRAINVGYDNVSRQLIDYVSEPGCRSLQSLQSGECPLGKFRGVEFDGRYVNFMPFCHYSGTDCKSTFLRYDTTQEFQSLESWIAINTKEYTDGGFRGSVFDGKYLYLIPNTEGDILRINLKK